MLVIKTLFVRTKNKASISEDPSSRSNPGMLRINRPFAAFIFPSSIAGGYSVPLEKLTPHPSNPQKETPSTPPSTLKPDSLPTTALAAG